jgi:hypothetical protein
MGDDVEVMSLKQKENEEAREKAWAAFYFCDGLCGHAARTT